MPIQHSGCHTSVALFSTSVGATWLYSDSVLFHIYMKTLGEIIQWSGVGCHQDADDTQLFSFPSNSREAKALESCLERANKLKLNPPDPQIQIHNMESTAYSD